MCPSMPDILVYLFVRVSLHEIILCDLDIVDVGVGSLLASLLLAQGALDVHACAYAH